MRRWLTASLRSREALPWRWLTCQTAWHLLSKTGSTPERRKTTCLPGKAGAARWNPNVCKPARQWARQINLAGRGAAKTRAVSRSHNSWVGNRRVVLAFLLERPWWASRWKINKSRKWSRWSAGKDAMWIKSAVLPESRNLVRVSGTSLPGWRTAAYGRNKLKGETGGYMN